MVAVNPLWQAMVAARQQYPDRKFLRADSEPCWMRYGELVTWVAKARQQLSQIGIHPGARVAIQLQSPNEFAQLWLAALSMDAVVVPLDSAAPAIDRERTLTKTGADWLVHDDFAPPPDRLGEVHWDGHGFFIVKPPRGPRLHRAGEGGVILLTSGSTGEPKPVGIPLTGLLYTAQQVVHAHGLRADDIGYSPLPLFHINGEVVGVLASLLAGAGIIVSDRFHARKFWPVLEHEPVTWLNLVPSILKVLAANPSEAPDTGRLRFIRSASAPLPMATLRAIEGQWRVPVIETYGLSEAGSQIAANPLHAPRPGSVGQATGVEIRVVGENGMVMPPGVVGEVEIRGPAVINPAWGPNRWALAKYDRGWYRTGDLGALDGSNYLYLSGRTRELINRGGEKIFPREVEEIILQHADLVDCAVVGRPHDLLGEEAVAFVVPKQPTTDVAALERDVAQMVAGRLSRFKCPAQYFVVNNLPKGATGKVSRQSLRNHAMALAGQE